jgi:phosphopantetheine--protein transferase-like protein
VKSADNNGSRHGIDLVDIARMRRLLAEMPKNDLLRIFSEREMADAAGGPEPARLAARFAAKEACLKLFPRETALGELEARDFEIVSDPYGAPHVNCTPRAADAMARHWIADFSLSLSHDSTHATAIAVAQTLRLSAPVSGRFMYHCLPIRRRVVVSNLKRAFGSELDEEQIITLAQAFYGHLIRSVAEFARMNLGIGARPVVQVQNLDAILKAYHMDKGVLLLSGHFGNWEVALPAAMENFPEYRGRFHILRRPIPRWLEAIVDRRMRKSGLHALPKRGSMQTILDRLAARDAVVFIMDQHAGGRDAVLADFFGSPAWTFRSLALIALKSGAPVVPAGLWREPDGSHVLRFEEALPTLQGTSASDAIAANTRQYNAALERIIMRHPEQWLWMHRRWKPR